MSKKTLTISIIAIIILALAGGVLWYLNKYQVLSIKYQGGDDGEMVENAPITENKNQNVQDEGGVEENGSDELGEVVTEYNNNEEPEVINKEYNKININDVGVRLLVPEKYTLTKNKEKNRRGSFVSYNFSYQKSLPMFDEIQFFSEQSIQKFTKNCGVDTVPCFFGDYPDIERYNGQKNAFYQGKDYEQYKLRSFADRNYFVSNLQPSDDRTTREYTTFIDDIKIDIWVTMTDNKQIAMADSIFETFKIIIEN